MGRIYITGDTHGDYDIQKIKWFKEEIGEDVSRDDVLIIAGDFGGLWSSYVNCNEETLSDRKLLDWWEKCPWTTLAVLGNHENYHAYDNYPQVMWNGGLCWQIRPHVYVATFGQYFTINDKTILTLNGARSHDISDGILERGKDDDQIALWWRDPYKMFRIKNESWWEEEIPAQDIRHIATDNLSAHGNQVDYIVSHEAPASMKRLLCYDTDEYSQWLETIRSTTDYTHWYCGHLHKDLDLNETDTILYHTIDEI